LKIATRTPEYGDLMSRWLAVGPDNYVLTTQGFPDTGLVVGTERAMVSDTGGGPRQGREILDAVRL
jgi:hypothetical protein